MVTPNWPVRCAAFGRVVAGSQCWALSGGANVSLVAKATFEMVAGAPMRLVEPEPIEVDEVRDPSTGAILRPSDLVPSLRHAEITLRGQAASPRVGLKVARHDAVLLEKILPDPAGFGPVASDESPRLPRLGGVDRALLHGLDIRVPGAHDWLYFQSAPDDQWLAGVRGDEWIMLLGLTGEVPEMASQLPGYYPACRLQGASAIGVPATVPFTPESLHVDAERRRVTLVWRGGFPIVSKDAASSLRAEVLLVEAGATPQWPSPTDPAPAAKPATRAMPAFALDAGAPHPFSVDPASAPLAPAGPVPAAPWSDDHGRTVEPATPGILETIDASDPGSLDDAVATAFAAARLEERKRIAALTAAREQELRRQEEPAGFSEPPHADPQTATTTQAPSVSDGAPLPFSVEPTSRPRSSQPASFPAAPWSADSGKTVKPATPGAMETVDSEDTAALKEAIAAAELAAAQKKKRELAAAEDQKRRSEEEAARFVEEQRLAEERARKRAAEEAAARREAARKLDDDLYGGFES